jgi:hypothetical protein
MENNLIYLFGELLFGVGTALMVSTIFKFSVINETTLFTIFMVSGAIFLFFGAILKLISKD